MSVTDLPLAKSQCGAALCPESGDKRKSLVHARNDVDDPDRTYVGCVSGAAAARSGKTAKRSPLRHHPDLTQVVDDAVALREIGRIVARRAGA
jgi:hypothetical protein